eukprot:357951-Chlamydomonas_euryale.AAC.6
MPHCRGPAAKVMHTASGSLSESLLFVDVVASIAKPEQLDIANTNVFSFVFSVRRGDLPRVLPDGEVEAARAFECMQAVAEVQRLMAAKQAQT